MLKFIFGSKIKYTCSCCGYKSLPTNSIGEICPICLWEEDYCICDNLSEVSSANHMMLYQAQENYKIYGCCNKELLKHSRKLFPIEKKDLNWQSIQNQIENKNNVSELVNKIHTCAEFLKQKDSAIVYQNFKSLSEIDIEYTTNELEVNFIEFGGGNSLEKFKYEIQLKSFLIALCNKKNTSLVLILFNDYYKKGLCYYLSWTIMLSVLINIRQLKLDTKTIDILLDIENNNYYGLASLEASLKKYWHKQSSC